MKHQRDIQFVYHRLFQTTLSSLAFCLVATCAAHAFTKVDDVIELDAPKEKPSVELSDPVKQLATPLKAGISESSISEDDKFNLDMLWGEVVAQNPIIQFGLKRLATPPEHREAHNSTMSRALGTLISGAGMVPYAFGAGELAAGGTVIGSNLANRAIFKVDNAELGELPSDRELVELSGLIQELQQDVVHNYFNYKGALIQLEALDHMNRYQPAFSESDLSGAESYLAMQNQISYQMAYQKAKGHLIILERLVGPKAIGQLRFSLPPGQTAASSPSKGLLPSLETAVDHSLRVQP